jgi:hypothetical protein
MYRRCDVLTHFGEEGVAGRAAGVGNAVVARPVTVREEALAEVQPDPLDGVQLKTAVRLPGTASVLARIIHERCGAPV